MLVIKFWKKWGVIYENLASGCKVKPKKIILGPFAPNLYTRAQPPLGFKIFNKKKSSLFHEILNQMKGCMWKSDRLLPNYAPKTILGPFAPKLHTRTQSPCETKFSKKKWSSVDHKILNKIRGYLRKSGKWLPSYAQKIILGPFDAPISILGPSPLGVLNFQ